MKGNSSVTSTSPADVPNSKMSLFTDHAEVLRLVLRLYDQWIDTAYSQDGAVKRYVFSANLIRFHLPGLFSAFLET